MTATEETIAEENTGKPGSLYQKIGIASLIMMASVLLSRVIGLLREVVIAYVGGTGAAVDAYQMAFVLPEILNHVAATGFLSITFIPIFNKYLVSNRETEGWRIFSLIISSFGSLLLLFIVAACFFADHLVALFAPGIDDPAIKALTIRMTRIVLPAQFFFFTGGLFMAVQFSKEHFLIPALAPLLYNLGIITGGLVAPWIGIEGFAWGVLGGAVAGNFAVQWFGAARLGMRFKFCFEWTHPDLKHYFLLTLPLILGLTMTFSTEFFFRFFGSYMPRGAVAALNYGLRITFILVGVFGQAVGTAFYPFISRLATEGRMLEMNRLLDRTVRALSMVIPFSVFLMVVRHEVVFMLFQRGRFDAEATALTAHLLPFLLLGAFAFSAQTIVIRGYYALQNTLFPALLGTAAVLLSIPVYMLSMQRMGVSGVALGVSVSAFMQVALLYVCWNRRTQNKNSRHVYGAVFKMMLLSIFLGSALEAIRRIVFSGLDATTFSGALLTCLGLGVLFLCLLYVACRIMKMADILEILEKPLQKLISRFRVNR
ncbi:MAG: murein biosynthesis integral membrane protein MurJ [Deltaproteobacteria bacterium]|nr:murein biosynthesis integral membrane protein MurJ [Deltaproteobacteria bacterium]